MQRNMLFIQQSTNHQYQKINQYIILQFPKLHIDKKRQKMESVNKNFLVYKVPFVKNFGGVKSMIAMILVIFQQELYK